MGVQQCKARISGKETNRANLVCFSERCHTWLWYGMSEIKTADANGKVKLAKMVLKPNPIV